MRTRNVVHLNGGASLKAQAEMPSGSTWTNATRPAVQTRSVWARAAWAKTDPVPAFRDENPEDEDPSLWHD